MNYRLSTGLVALGVSFVIGSSALAAPGVVYKKQLSVPTVPSTIISKLSAMDWDYTTTASTTNGMATFKNVVLEKPVIQGEQDCNGIMYRVWRISVNVDATKKTQPSIRYDQSPYYGGSFGTRYAYEARTPNTVKWHIDQAPNGLYSFERPYPNYVTPFFGCKGSDIVTMNTATNPRSGLSINTYKDISFANFTNDANWSANNLSLGVLPFIASAPSREVTDGITQVPGVLITWNGTVRGNSQVTTVDSKNGLHVHTLPRYRDLTAVATTEQLQSLFYRLHDGYGVIEMNYKTGGTTYYRIRNGEAQYSVVDSLPLNKQSGAYQNINGITAANILIHGLPASGYESRSNIVWETDAQTYIRYTITNISTGKQQYWEATVNKN
ncbi:MAG: hypothetical protein U0487_03910 [Patescibacteria group bacterium]